MIKKEHGPFGVRDLLQVQALELPHGERPGSILHQGHVHGDDGDLACSDLVSGVFS